MSGPKYDFGIDKKTRVGNLAMSSSYIHSWHANALVVSEGHCPTRQSSRYQDQTGNFYVWKRKLSHSGGTDFTYATLSDGKLTHHIEGVPSLSFGAPAFPFSATPTFASASAGLSGQYATGYAKARPGNPVTSLAQFAAELRQFPAIPFKSFFGKPKKNRRYGPVRVPVSELPRKLFEQFQDYFRFGNKKDLSFKNLGGEYLNYVFGWKPMLDDLRKMYYLQKDIDKRMAQIIRENDKRLTRRATVSQSSTLQMGATVGSLATVSEGSDARMGNLSWSSRTAFPFSGVLGGPSSSRLLGHSTSAVMRKTTAKEWFVGKFQYSIPDTGSWQWNKAARLALFGGIPTFETIWELTPWSWLIDWFSNVGDIMSNASPNAVGFAPALWSSGIHRVTTEDETHMCNVHLDPPTGLSPTDKWNGGDFIFSSTRTTYSKVRLGGGNPFGLNVTLPSLSGSQLGILAALGISRSKVK